MTKGFLGEFHPECRRIPVALAIWSIAFLQNSVLKSMGVLLPVLVAQFPSNTSDIGAIVSFLFLSGNLLGLLTQFLTRYLQARIILVCCGVISSIGLLISSQADSLQVVVIGMLLTGCVCMGNTLALGLISTYFDKYYAEATNMITTAFPLSIMASAPMAQLFINLYGWRGAMFVCCSLNLHFIVAALVIKPLQKPEMKCDISYQKLTSRSDDLDHDNCDNSGLLDIFNVSLLKNSQLVVILFISFIIGYMYNGLLVYVVSIAQSKGLSPVSAAVVATFSGIGALLVRIILAVLQVKAIYYKQLFVLGAFLAVLAYGGMYPSTSFMMLSVCSTILGVSSGLLGPQEVIALKATVNEEDTVGAMGWLNLTHGFGYILSGYMSGWLFDVNRAFDLALIAQCVASSLIIILLAGQYVWLYVTNSKTSDIKTPTRY